MNCQGLKYDVRRGANDGLEVTYQLGFRLGSEQNFSQEINLFRIRVSHFPNAKLQYSLSDNVLRCKESEEGGRGVVVHNKNNNKSCTNILTFFSVVNKCKESCGCTSYMYKKNVLTSRDDK